MIFKYGVILIKILMGFLLLLVWDDYYYFEKKKRVHGKMTEVHFEE